MYRLFGFVLLAGLLMQAPAMADTNTKLFKNYGYDDPIALFTEEKGYFECPDFSDTVLCKTGVEFLGAEFDLILYFDQNTLSHIALFSEFDSVLYAKAIGALTNSFTLLRMRGAGEQVDLVELTRNSSSKAEMKKIINNFERNRLEEGHLEVEFIEVSAADAKNRENVEDVISHAPSTVRVATMIVFEDEDEGEDFIMLAFTQPRLQQAKVKRIIESTTEKF